MSKFPKTMKRLETKVERLGQYDYFDEELMYKKEAKYAPLIGSFLISFSSLEHIIDLEIAEVINERSHDYGYMVLKNLEFWAKIELFYDLSYPVVCSTNKPKNQKMLHLKDIKSRLESLAVLRNKIAHAKWYTLDKEGYVRVATKTDKDNGLINFKKLKITPAIIKRGLKEIEVLSEKLPDFTEKLLEQ